MIDSNEHAINLTHFLADDLIISHVVSRKAFSYVPHKVDTPTETVYTESS